MKLLNWIFQKRESNMQIAAREMREARIQLQELLIYMIEKHNKRIEDEQNKNV